MSRIEEALARLADAVVRIERASANARVIPNPAGADMEMAAELRQAREDYAALKGKTDGVAKRLDAAIMRLDGVLDEAVE